MSKKHRGGFSSRLKVKILGGAALTLTGGILFVSCGTAIENAISPDEEPTATAPATPTGTETATATETETEPETNISGEEGETVYLYARQAFSPSLDRWTVDEQMEELTYTRYNCLGGVEAESPATLEPRKGKQTATWVGSNPMRGGGNSEYISLKIDEHTLSAYQDTATTQHESVLADYSEMCTKAGKSVARFVLP